MQKRVVRTCIAGAALSVVAIYLACAQTPVRHDDAGGVQGVSLAILQAYHHTDQGTRIIPAAFLAALRTPDGGSRIMDPVNVRNWGFIVDDVRSTARNPYGWPLGWTVSDPVVTRGIPVAGVTCAACHTGQVAYKGRVVRIEGGQANIDLPAFQTAVFAALLATASAPGRRAAFLQDAVAAGYPADRVEPDFQAAIATARQSLQAQKGLSGTEPGPGRVDAVQGIANAVFASDLQVPSNAQNYNAPVNYPYLWDIWRLSWLQYNGFLPPAADSRNIGEVLGTGGKVNLVDPATGTLNPAPQRWDSSIQMKNLIWMESVVKNMKAPRWPTEVFGAIDRTKANRGRQLFIENCAACHGIRRLPNGLWDVTIVSLQHIGTDPNQATNWANRTYDASKLGLGHAVHATAMGGVINEIRNYLYAKNDIAASLREGDVSLDAPCGYKARPLIGVWATAPFLHNGSVRTVYDLLSDTRPASFRYGNFEYDPVKLGYTEDPAADAKVLDASLDGNSNKGHWWTDDAKRPGRIGRKFNEAEKFALIEYLKAATYENYPTVDVTSERERPCTAGKYGKQAQRFGD